MSKEQVKSRSWRARLGAAGGALLAGIGVLLGVELVLLIAGMPSYRQLVWQASGFASDKQQAAVALQRYYQQRGRAYRVEGSSIWLYHPFSSPFLRVNRLGLRGAEVLPRQPQELRIAVLGGSAVYGWLVADDDTIPALLQSELQAQLPERRIRVFNLGVEGYRLQQELELLDRVLPQIDPDVLVFYHGGNDILTTVLRGGYVEDEPWHGDNEPDLLVVAYQPPGLLSQLRRGVKHSRLCTLGLLARLYLKVGMAPESLEQSLPLDLQAARTDLVAGYQIRLAELRILCRTHGLRAMVFLQPLVYSRQQPTAAEQVRLMRSEEAAPGLGLLWHAVSGDLVQLATDEVPIIDLRNVVAPSPDTLFQDWAHLSPYGNRLIAEAIADQLLAQECLNGTVQHEVVQVNRRGCSRHGPGAHLPWLPPWVRGP